jgi:hypothetical protein
MQLKAISIGYAFPRSDFEATIHSVFQSAANFRLIHDNALLTVVASGEPDLPQGIRVDASSDFSFQALRAGEPVTCQENFLRFDAVTIALREAKPWRCDLPSLKADMTDPAVTAAWKAAWQVLNKQQFQSQAEIIAEELFDFQGGAQNIVSRKVADAMHGLTDATRRLDLAATTSIHPLIGLGSGLTPSGDDLLLGYLAGLWCGVWNKGERIQFLKDLGEVVIRLSHGTNDISRTYLHHAARGQVSSRLADLAGAICRGENSDRLVFAVESATRIGHTSGMDAVTGLLLGLGAWSPPLPNERGV